MTVWWNVTPPASALAPDDVTSGSSISELDLVPSSGERADSALRLVRAELRASDVPTRVIVPRAPASTVLGGVVGKSEAWTRVDIDGWSARIDRRIDGAMPTGIITISADRAKGPFALDLAAQFLHPVDRTRVLLSRDQPRLIAGIAASARFRRWLIATRAGEGVLWLATEDIIAAELWSLTLAERFLDHSLEMQGPWEDPTVQRATELDLGVRVPSEIRLILQDADALPNDVSRLIVTGCGRIGMRVPAELR